MRASLMLAVFAVLALPGLTLALETKNAKVGKLNVVFETEGPYVESGQQAFALPSVETAVEVKKRDAVALAGFLRQNCAKTPGCELTYETETKAVVAAKAPNGQSFTVAYTAKAKKSFQGEAREISAVLKSWIHDTYAIVVYTTAGNFCVFNEYAWRDYQMKLDAALEALGEQNAPLNKKVTLTVYPAQKQDHSYENCKGYLADVRPAK
jgi:hypothetical protein